MNRRRVLAALGGLGSVGIGAYHTHTTTISEPGARDGQLLLGISPEALDLDELSAMEHWLGQRHAIVVRFWDLGINEETIEANVEGGLTGLWRNGYIPLVMLQPFFGDETPTDITRQIANGKHDETIDHWARILGNWVNQGRTPHDRRVYLSVAPEMNGDWTPWSPAAGDTDEQDFIDMWRAIHDRFVDAGLEDHRAQWMWTVNHTSRDTSIDALYPGDDYVDWTSIHGYNWYRWGGWADAEHIYGGAIRRIRRTTDRPLAITEFGCSSEVADGHDPERKGKWIRETFDYFHEQDIRMACIFNIDKETDWAVFGGERGTATTEVGGEPRNVYPAYREVVQDRDVLGPHPEHRRILADDEFMGRF